MNGGKRTGLLMLVLVFSLALVSKTPEAPALTDKKIKAMERAYEDFMRQSILLLKFEFLFNKAHFLAKALEASWDQPEIVDQVKIRSKKLAAELIEFRKMLQPEKALISFPVIKEYLLVGIKILLDELNKVDAL